MREELWSDCLGGVRAPGAPLVPMPMIMCVYQVAHHCFHSEFKLAGTHSQSLQHRFYAQLCISAVNHYMSL